MSRCLCFWLSEVICLFNGLVVTCLELPLETFQLFWKYFCSWWSVFDDNFRQNPLLLSFKYQQVFLMCVAFNSFHCFCCFSMMMKFFYLVVLHDKASRHALFRFVKGIIHLVRSSVLKGSFTYVCVWGCKNCYFFRNFSIRIKGMIPYLISAMFLLYQSSPFRQKKSK